MSQHNRISVNYFIKELLFRPNGLISADKIRRQGSEAWQSFGFFPPLRVDNHYDCHRNVGRLSPLQTLGDRLFQISSGAT